MPDHGDIQGLQGQPLLGEVKALEIAYHPLAIGGQRCRFHLHLGQQPLLVVQACELPLDTDASSTNVGLLGLEVGEVNDLTQTRRFPPLEVFLVLGNLSLVVLPITGQIALLRTGSLLPPFQFGGNESRIL
jgi:hypothetical protein